MRFRDIPQFIQNGNYEVDVSLKELLRQITRYLEMGLQLNPDFQRGHVWTEGQQTAYVEFLLRGGKSGRTILLNHPGWMRDWKGEFVCVDGLQRLTACLRFMNNEIPAFDCVYRDYEDNIGFDNPTLCVNVNSLKTRHEVLQWYLQINTGGTPHTEMELDKVRDLLSREQEA